jgi:hypothetical protein
MVPPNAQHLFPDTTALKNMYELRAKYVTHLLHSTCTAAASDAVVQVTDLDIKRVVEHLKDAVILSNCAALDGLQAIQAASWSHVWLTALTDLASHATTAAARSSMEMAKASILQASGLSMPKEECTEGGAKKDADPVMGSVWMSVESIHEIGDEPGFKQLSDEAPGGLLSQSADAMHLGGLNVTAPFIKMLTAHMNAKVSDFLMQDTGLENLKYDIMVTNPTLIATEVTKDMRLHLAGAVSIMSAPGSIGLTEAFGIKFYTSGTGFRGPTTECCVPAWSVPVVSDEDATFEYTIQEVEFFMPECHGPWEAAGYKPSDCGHRFKPTVTIKGAAVGAGGDISWPLSIVTLTPKAEYIGKKDVQVTRPVISELEVVKTAKATKIAAKHTPPPPLLPHL